MDLTKLLSAVPNDFGPLLEKWDELADRVCLVVAALGVICFFASHSGQFLCLAASTAALGVLATWRIFTHLRDGSISAGRASFLFGTCAPLFLIYVALIWVQQYQGEFCVDKTKQDLITIGCWLLCCIVASGPGGLLGTFIGYFFTGTAWTLFERASVRVLDCKHTPTPAGLPAFMQQPFLKPKDLHFIIGLTAISTMCFLVGISVVLRFAAAGYTGLGLIPSTVAQLKAFEIQNRPAPPPSPYRFEDPMTAE
jgi:hypothetical protein